ncbi:MAG: hypothetical protein HXS52_07935 [Theionarchaea archaeon]|nr:hypothetical protein [Theionarchaea archaeon]
MKKIPVLVLALCLSVFIPAAQPQEDELPAGKELSILLSVTVIDYQASVQDFFFQQKLLGATSLESKLHILVTQIDELTAIMIQLDRHRMSLIQSLQNATITTEQFTVEMRKLAAEVLILARSFNGLGQSISETVLNVPPGAEELALFVLEKFNAAAGLISEMGVSVSQTVGQQGLDVFFMPEIPQIPEMAKESGEEESQSEDSEKSCDEEGSQARNTGKPGEAEEDLRSRDTGKPGEAEEGSGKHGGKNSSFL